MKDNDVLLKRAVSGDKSAEDELVRGNMGLVYSVAGRFSNRGYDMEDLTQVGVIGLIKAIRRFDTGFNVRFSTYAVPMILGEIRRYIRDDGMIKVSRSVKEAAAKAKRVREELCRNLGREPTIGEIAEKSGLTPDQTAEALEATAAYESIYEAAKSSGGDREIMLLDRISSGGCEDEIVNKVMIEAMLESLSARERLVIEQRYFKCSTQTQLASMLGVSQVQISRIEKRALEKIRLEFHDAV